MKEVPGETSLILVEDDEWKALEAAEQAALMRGRTPALDDAYAAAAGTDARQPEGSTAGVNGPQHKRSATVSPSTLRAIISKPPPETRHIHPVPVNLFETTTTSSCCQQDVAPAPPVLHKQQQPQPQQQQQQQQPQPLQPGGAQPPLPQTRRLPFTLIQQPQVHPQQDHNTLKPAPAAPATFGNQCSRGNSGGGNSSGGSAGSGHASSGHKWEAGCSGTGGATGCPAVGRLQRRQSDSAIVAPRHAAAGVALEARLPAAAYRGRITYAKTAAEVDAACAVLLRSGARLVGFDIEWRSTFKKGAPVGKAALLQLCYNARDGTDAPTASDGRGAVALLLHIIHSGVTPRLREVLAREELQLVGVNIGGDAMKMLNDWGVRCTSCCELGDLANGRVLAHLPGVAMNIETRRWSLASLAANVLGLEVPKPQHIRLGNWEGRLTDEHKHYAALDAFMGLHLHWALSALPKRLGPSERHREELRARAQQAALAKAAAAGCDAAAAAAAGGGSLAGNAGATVAAAPP